MQPNKIVKEALGTSNLTNLAKDSDKDRLINPLDCQPYNSKKQGWIHTAGSWVAHKIGAHNTAERIEQKGQEVDYEREQSQIERRERQLADAEERKQIKSQERQWKNEEEATKREVMHQERLKISKEQAIVKARRPSFMQSLGAGLSKGLTAGSGVKSTGTGQSNMGNILFGAKSTPAITKAKRSKVVSYKKLKSGKYKKITSYKTKQIPTRTTSVITHNELGTMLGSGSSVTTNELGNMLGTNKPTKNKVNNILSIKI
jgi:hypothetical protein